MHEKANNSEKATNEVVQSQHKAKNLKLCIYKWKINSTIRVAKTKALISFAVTVSLFSIRLSILLVFSCGGSNNKNLSLCGWTVAGTSSNPSIMTASGINSCIVWHMQH